jgi:quercetin dioxygenase-like cupin family protein
MTTATLALMKKSFASPDVLRRADRARVELATVEDVTLARIVLQPGWRWSQHARPAAGTDNCRMHHAQLVISGRLHVALDDGEQLDLGPGDFASIPPEHDSWVVGDEPYVCIEFSPDVRRYGRER